MFDGGFRFGRKFVRVKRLSCAYMNNGYKNLDLNLRRLAAG
jgi:hypothetical protein